MEGEACRTLESIDSLMWQQPDSAFALLQAFAVSSEADSLDESDIHYFQLLLSELLYKNDCEQTNRKDLLRAVAYYDSIAGSPGAEARGMSVWPFRRRDASHASAQTTAFLAARAHYINGVGYYERDSVVEACAEYLKTLEIMEGTFEDKELTGHKAQFMACTFNRLGDLFSEQLMMKPSIECFENALVFCRIKPTSPQGIANILSRLGLQYDKLGDKEKMRCYYEQALEEMPAMENSNYRDLMAIVALCDYQLGSGIEKPMKTMMEVLDKAEDDSERLSRYLTIGDIYYEEGQYDSALRYLKPVFEKQEAVALKVQVAGFLHDIYSDQGDDENADKYAHYIVSQKKSEGENMVVVSKLDGMYQDYLHKKQEKQAEEAREQSVKKTVGIIVPITVMVALVVFILLKLRHKKLLKEQQREADRMLESEERSHQKEIESERQAHQVQQAALSGRLRRSNGELRELKEQIRRQEDADAKSGHAASFAEEPICRLIMERVNEGQFKSKVDCEIYKQYALDKRQLFELREAVDRHFSQYTLRLRKAYPDLTDMDVDYCCLYLLNLTNADISALMHRAYNTVVERESKIQRITGNEKPLSVTLKDLSRYSASI
jgi:tetratricopeptide (TPR) repeat protein